MRAIVLGKSRAAIRAAEILRTNRRYELSCVVPAVPEPMRDPLGAWAHDRGIPVVETGEVRDMGAPGPDLAVSVFYNRILPPSWLATCGRAVNLHPSPLPRYRGVLPVNWALQNGETTHGVTLHELTPGIDDGPVLAQVTFPVFTGIDGPRHLYERALDHSELLLAHTLPHVDALV